MLENKWYYFFYIVIWQADIYITRLKNEIKNQYQYKLKKNQNYNKLI
jgi:hypothetical protein